jgi:DNA-binding LacI/PurR family transcriptional regulator
LASKSKVTSRRVAELAGVSQTTVSFVMNDIEGANISEETKRRVQEAAQSLGYVPDVAARALARGRSANVALVLLQPHSQVFTDEYISNIITGLSLVTKKNGYRILLELVDEAGNLNAITNLMRGREAAGIIVNLNVANEEEYQRITDYTVEGYPTVSLEYCHPLLNSVTVDKLHGVKQAMEHLLKLGHRRIACITYGPSVVRHVSQRLHVYRQMLEQAGMTYDESLIREGDYDPDSGHRAMESLLDLSPLPTALFAMNDVMAFGAMTAIREHDLRVPEDIAVVGFDDIRLARYTNPALTTIYEPDVEQGRQATEMLIQLIAGKPVEKPHITLKTKLIVRESCGYRKNGAGSARLNAIH